MTTFAEFHAEGNVPEDVINALFDISVTDRPLTGRIAHIGAASSLKDWLDHVLRKPKADNAIIDGTRSNNDETSKGTRFVQPMQLADANITLGDQASESDSFGNITKFETQLGYRVSELYRDVEANALSDEPSVLPVDDTVAGRAAGFFAQVKTATNHGIGGSAGGWDAPTGVFTAPQLGTRRPFSEADLLSVLETMSRNGARPDMLQMITELKGKFSGFMMTSSSRVGVLVTQAPGGQGGATAVQSVQTYETDYGALEVINNQVMQPENEAGGSEMTHAAVVQSNMAECADQWTPRAKRMGPSGAGESWQVTCSSGMLLLTEKAHGGVFDIDYTTPMIA